MKKLSLDLNALQVQSFKPEDATHESRGTVQGQEQADTEEYGEDTGLDTIIISGQTIPNCGTSCGLFFCDTNQSCNGGFEPY
jgi:hypothetical protein